MKKNTFRLHILKPDGAVSSYDYNKKPTFKDMYQLIGCDMLQPSSAYLPKYSNRKDGYVEFYMDEEFLLKNPVPQVNSRVTSAWYKWQEKTGHIAHPGSVIHGNVAVIQKCQ